MTEYAENVSFGNRFIGQWEGAVNKESRQTERNVAISGNRRKGKTMSRLIDKDAVLEMLSHYEEHAHGWDERNAIGAIKYEIENAPTIEPSDEARHAYYVGWCNGEDAEATRHDDKWIPCEERLPEEEGVYLVSCYGKTYLDTLLGFTDGDEGEVFCDWDISSCVPEEELAWMPLPEPYKMQSVNAKYTLNRCPNCGRGVLVGDATECPICGAKTDCAWK